MKNKAETFENSKINLHSIIFQIITEVQTTVILIHRLSDNCRGDVPELQID